MKIPLSVAIFLGFAPYVAFFVFMRLAGVEIGLWAALVAAMANAARDWARNHALKVLEIGNVVLFGALAVATAALHLDWTVMTVRLAVDIGLLGIILASLAIGTPFTLQYARERVPEAIQATPLFLRVNRIVTAAWAFAFALLVASHAAVVWLPGVPLTLDIVVTIAVLAGAIRFSTWYPARVRARAALAPRKQFNSGE